MHQVDDRVIIGVNDLYKIFGENPLGVIELVKQGISKDELLQNHQHILGLRNINIDLFEGHITVIMGLSGSGKSTLIRHLNRLIDPTIGVVNVYNEDILQKNHSQIRLLRQTTMSMVFQRFALFPHQTILENTMLAPTTRNDDKHKALADATRWLQRVGLEGYEDSYPRQLSGGMQQRVGIARALTSNSPIMLMDEAFSALDPLIRSNMQDLLLDLQQELKKTVVFITHDLDEALKLADRLVILKDGEVIQQGEPQSILLNPKDEYIEDFVSHINRAKVLRVRSIMIADVSLEVDGQVDFEDNLESVIKLSNGQTSKDYAVMKEDKRVGTVKMSDLVKALVPTVTTTSKFNHPC